MLIFVSCVIHRSLVFSKFFTSQNTIDSNTMDIIRIVNPDEDINVLGDM